MTPDEKELYKKAYICILKINPKEKITFFADEKRKILDFIKPFVVGKNLEPIDAVKRFIAMCNTFEYGKFKHNEEHRLKKIEKSMSESKRIRQIDKEWTDRRPKKRRRNRGLTND